jgi:hypothetical protein
MVVERRLEMRNLIKCSIVLIVIGSIAGLAWANKACQTPNGDFNIMISPSTLVLSSPSDVITVHSNIPYGAVIATSVAVNGVDVPFTKSDSCGDLVAKIGVNDLAEFLQPDQVITLTLSGMLIDETTFAVDETISVKE